MNIFWLDTDLEKCAQMHVDKHVVKMPTEYAQMLSACLVHWGYEAPYKLTHQNHPCTKWARKHKGNYQLLWDLADALGREYNFRYGKIHKAHKLLLSNTIPRDIDTGEKEIIRTPLPNCTSIKEGIPPETNLCDIYRMFYMQDKAHILSWKKRGEPFWMGDRFYQQQYQKTLGSLPEPAKPGTTKTKRRTKDDFVKELGTESIRKLLLTDLTKLSFIDFVEVPTLQIPGGRLKKPYIEVCNQVCEDIDWKKLTVAEIKDFIAHVNYIK